MKAFSKTTYWSIVAILAVFLAVPQVFAQGQKDEPGIGKGPESGIHKGRTITDEPYDPAKVGEAGVEYKGMSAHRASTLIGKPVVSSSGEKVGTLNDLVLFEGGNVHYAIVHVENRTDKQFVPVPYNSLASMDGEEQLTVDLDQETLSNAPGFSREELATWWKTDIGEEVHGYYGFGGYAKEPGVGKGPESGIYKGRTIEDKPYKPSE